MQQLKNIDIEEDIIIYAFRYCLGRKTFAVPTMCDFLKMYWDSLSNKTKSIIKRDIRSCDDLGMAMDKKEWEKVLEL